MYKVGTKRIPRRQGYEGQSDLGRAYVYAYFLWPYGEVLYTIFKINQTMISFPLESHHIPRRRPCQWEHPCKQVRPVKMCQKPVYT